VLSEIMPTEPVAMLLILKQRDQQADDKTREIRDRDRMAQEGAKGDPVWQCLPYSIFAGTDRPTAVAFPTAGNGEYNNISMKINSLLRLFVSRKKQKESDQNGMIWL
jgi:hypothetical protein